MSLGLWRQGVTRKRITATTLPATITTNGALYLGPSRKQAATFDSGTGVNIQADDVTIVNPNIVDYQTAIRISRKGNGDPPKRVRIIYDPTQPGGGTALIDHNRTGIYITQADGVEVCGTSTTNKFPFLNCYRPIQIEAGTNMDLHHIISTHPLSYDWASSGRLTSIEVIKCLPDVTWGANSDGKFNISNVKYRYVDCYDVWDEALSFDSRGDTPAKMNVRETDTVASVNAGAGTVTMSSANWAASGADYTGYYLVFINHAQSGKPQPITAQSGATVTVDDALGILSSVGAGTRLSIMSPFLDCEVANCYVESPNSKTPFDVHGGGFRMLLHDCELIASTRFRYSELGTDFDMREVSAGVEQFCAGRFSSARGFMSDLSVTGNNRAAPTEYCQAYNNTFRNGDFNQHMIFYGGTTFTSRNYTPTGNTYTDNTGDGAQFWSRNQTLL